MSCYVDTSVLIAAHTHEQQTSLAQNWLMTQQGSDLILSVWTLVECESALAIKFRRGEIDEVDHIDTTRELREFTAKFSPIAVPIEQDFQKARELCRNVLSGLRSGDALHLAMALRLDVALFVTFDRILNKNAEALGLKTQFAAE
jgi:uncharacterized protein